jgi:hypothetical protein
VEVDDEGRETVVAEPPGVAPDEAARRLWRYALNGDASMVRRLTGRPISDRAVAVFCGFATPVVLGKAPLTDEWWATLERRASSNSPASVLYASLRLAYEAGGLGRNIGRRKRVAIAGRCIVCGRVYEPRGRARTCGHPDCRKELARRRYRRWYLLHRQASGRARLRPGPPPALPTLAGILDRFTGSLRLTPHSASFRAGLPWWPRAGTLVVHHHRRGPVAGGSGPGYRPTPSPQQEPRAAVAKGDTWLTPL